MSMWRILARWAMRGANGVHLQAVRSLGIRASVGKGGEEMASFCLRENGQIRYRAVSSAALSLLPIQPSSSPVKLPRRGSQDPGHQMGAGEEGRQPWEEDGWAVRGSRRRSHRGWSCRS